MIEIISGTNRPNCNALRVAQLIESLYKQAGVEARILNLQHLPAEIFDPSSYAEKPASFAPFANRVLEADGLHIVTPEYNGSFPGVLKYFIDMLKFPESFEHRCVCFTGEAAGVWGAIRPVEQLQMIFNYRNAFMLPHRTFIKGIGKKFNEDGTLNDEFEMNLLREQVKQFIAFVERNKGVAVKSA